MSYGIEWGRKTDSLLVALDPWLAAAILNGADRLASAPTAVSRPGGWPNCGRDQRYRLDVGGRQVTLFFRYDPDEQRLHITDVSILPPP